MFAVCPSPTGQAGRIRKNNALRRHYEPSACAWLASRFDSASGVCIVPVRAYSSWLGRHSPGPSGHPLLRRGTCLATSSSADADGRFIQPSLRGMEGAKPLECGVSPGAPGRPRRFCLPGDWIVNPRRSWPERRFSEFFASRISEHVVLDPKRRRRPCCAKAPQGLTPHSKGSASFRTAFSFRSSATSGKPCR
jgi:hypothetical protein